MGIFIGVAFAAILGALVTAGVLMVRGGRGSDDPVGGAPGSRSKDSGSKGGGMMRALALRVALSVALFVCLLSAWWLGWIHPSGMPLGR